MSDLRLNLENPKKKHLDYFSTSVMIPETSEDRTELIDVPGYGEVRLPKLEYNTYDSNFRKKFKYDGKTYKPRKMFFNQNEGLKKIKGKYAADKVQERVDKATKMPTLKFALEPVQLVPRSYGRTYVKDYPELYP